MSILIKGMEMPKDREIILRIDEKGEVYIYGSYPTELYSAVDGADALNDAHNEGYDVGYWAGRRDYEPKWIPVEERLPEVFKHVLVNIPSMAPHPMVQEAFREKNGMWYSNGFRYGADEITHWMPLPMPPKENMI